MRRIVTALATVGIAAGPLLFAPTVAFAAPDCAAKVVDDARRDPANPSR